MRSIFMVAIYGCCIVLSCSKGDNPTPPAPIPVKIAPDTVRQLSVTPGASAITVSFATPSFTGSVDGVISTIISYDIVINNVVKASPTAAGSTTITGLSNGTIYTVKIITKSSNTLTSTSAVSNEVIPRSATTEKLYAGGKAWYFTKNEDRWLTDATWTVRILGPCDKAEKYYFGLNMERNTTIPTGCVPWGKLPFWTSDTDTTYLGINSACCILKTTITILNETTFQHTYLSTDSLSIVRKTYTREP